MDPYATPEESLAPAPAPLPVLPREHRLEFSATAGDYFRVWIVNLALTIATLGIYSAWAKVRRKRFFYERTRLDGDPFEYRGRPIAILKGRLVAAAVVGSFWIATHFFPMALLGFFALAVVGVPYLMVRSFAFNAASSGWRNVRFSFRGGYWRCLRIVVVYGLFTAFTAGLAYAFFKTRFTEFVVRNHAFGATRFDVPSLKKAFFNAYGKLIGLGLLVTVAISALTFALLSITHGKPQGSAWTYGFNAINYLLYLGLFCYIRVRVVNHTWNNATLGPLRFRSSLSVREMYKLYVTNIAAILCTAGLATPWAVVRTMRYRAERTVIVASEDLATLRGAEATDVPATGEEVAEMFDMDFSL